MKRSVRVTTIVLKTLVPLVGLAASVGAAKWFVATKSTPPQETKETAAPAVRAALVQRETVCFPISVIFPAFS